MELPWFVGEEYDDFVNADSDDAVMVAAKALDQVVLVAAPELPKAGQAQYAIIDEIRSLRTQLKEQTEEILVSFPSGSDPFRSYI